MWAVAGLGREVKQSWAWRTLARKTKHKGLHCTELAGSGVAGSGWQGQVGRVRVAGSGWQGQGGRVRVARAGWLGQGGRAGKKGEGGKVL
jgi:hypothetical protein